MNAAILPSYVVMAASLLCAGQPSSTPSHKKAATHTSKAAKIIAIRQDIELEAGADVEVRTIQPPLTRDEQGRPKRQGYAELEELEDPNAPGFAADFSALKAGHAVRVSITKTGGEASTKTKAESNEKARARRADELIGVLTKVDSAKRKFTVRVESLALYGSARHQHVSKESIRDFMAEHRVRQILILSPGVEQK
jgi:hypothetical protein